MKSPRILSIGVMGVCAGLIVACDAFGPSERIAVLDIAPEQVACVGVSQQTCLRVRERPDTAWTLFYFGIEGFTFEPGFEYTLRVAIRTVKNPPADGSSLAYRLLETMRKAPPA
jgi:hypothetical protein